MTHHQWRYDIISGVMAHHQWRYGTSSVALWYIISGIITPLMMCHNATDDVP